LGGRRRAGRGAGSGRRGALAPEQGPRLLQGPPDRRGGRPLGCCDSDTELSWKRGQKKRSEAKASKANEQKRDSKSAKFGKSGAFALVQGRKDSKF